MFKFILRRMLSLIPVLFGLTFISFLLLYISPGDAATRRLLSSGVAVTKEVIELTKKEMGLDKPFFIQYFNWLMDIIKGNFGISYKDSLPVLPKLIMGLKNTFILSSFSLIISILVATPLGIISAIYKGKTMDRIINVFFLISNSMPNFLIATILIYLFCVKFRIFPIIAKSNLSGLFLPALSLAFPISGRFTRQIKIEVLNELSKSYVNGLKTKGILWKYIVFNNVLRNALPGIITVISMSFATMLGGAIITEVIFNWKGIGHIVMSAILFRDYPVIQGFVLFMGVIYVVINLITDIVYKILDYRVKIK